MEDAGSGLENSFTDLMTSLAVIFILLLCSLMNNAFNEAQITRSKKFEQLQTKIKEYLVKGIELHADPHDPTVFSILVPENLLQFERNSYEITPSSLEFLAAFVPKLTDAIYSEEFRSEIGAVVVEGHTDSSGSDALNLELSQRRSLSVVNKSIDILKAEGSSAEKIDYFLRVLTANGRGEQDLIMVDGKEDPQKSRRVVFKIKVRSAEQG